MMIIKMMVMVMMKMMVYNDSMIDLICLFSQTHHHH